MNIQPTTPRPWSPSPGIRPVHPGRFARQAPPPEAPPSRTRVTLLSEVDSVEAAANRFVIREYYIRAVCVTPQTQLFHLARDEAQRIPLEALRPGDWVEVRGTLQPGTIGPVIANEVIRLRPRLRRVS